MKILGITAEYNPFHNGHKYHMDRSAEMTGAGYTVVVMSGNFTQRGEPAILDKWTRSRLAVENGTDLVLELPFVFACNRAETFARGAVDILSGLGATHISFGSESGELDALEMFAGELHRQEPQIAERRTFFMKQGNSFAKSNQMAVEDVLGKERALLMMEPNNILALEYLKRISYRKEQGQAIEPVTVKRHGSGYFDGNEEAGFAGASYIRSMIKQGSGRNTRAQISEVSRYVPGNVKGALEEAFAGGVSGKPCADGDAHFFQLVRSLIVRSSAEELAEIYCMGEGLENRFKKEIVSAASLAELLSAMVSRRYTEAAIRRLLVYILTGMKEKDPPEAHYARVLAAGRKGQELLRIIKKKELNSIPLITNINKEKNLPEEARSALHYDMLASDMYNLLQGRDLYAFSDKVIKPYME